MKPNMSGASAGPIVVERSGAIVRVTLSRPERKNAIDRALVRELRRAAEDLEKDESVRVIVLSGAGDAFSVGGDINEFVTHKARLTDFLEEMMVDMHAMVLAFRRAPAPVLVAVNGIAAGGGLGLVAGGDMAIAKRSARFASAFTRSGLSPDSGTTWFLPRLVGHQRAFDLMATNRILSADEALAMGLVARVVDDADFARTVDEVAQTLAALPSGAGHSVKRLMVDETLAELEAHLAAEARRMAAMGSQPETLAKIDAFFAK